MARGRIHPRPQRKERAANKKVQNQFIWKWWEVLADNDLFWYAVIMMCVGITTAIISIIRAHMIPQDSQLVKMTTVNIPGLPINVIDYSASGLNSTGFDLLMTAYGVEHRTTYRDFLLIETLSLPFIAFGLLVLTVRVLDKTTFPESYFYRSVVMIPVFWFLAELCENLSYLSLLYFSIPVQPFVHETLSWLTWKLLVLSMAIPLIALRITYQNQLDNTRQTKVA